MGVGVRDRFRDLEGPLTVRKKDVVLMATVSSFECMPHPAKSALRQFAELFTPLFQASSDEAKRQAVAALSQCPNVPPAVALFIGSQPIAIAAPFLASSQIIDDDTLITIARTQGAAHARAIVRREQLSPKVIDALVSLRQAEPGRGGWATEGAIEQAPLPQVYDAHPSPADDVQSTLLAREEALRREIKQIARHLSDGANDRLGLRTLSDVQEALLVRFAREREAAHFATTLADALSASCWLAERILLDLSGQQLAVTLTSLGMGLADAVFVLERFYPHLSDMHGSVSRAWLVLDDADPEDCERRVEAWRRADRYTYLPEERSTPLPSRPAVSQFTRQVAPSRDLRTVARAFGGSR
ncbi:hypothetical protein CPY51_02415 [Rhizobium tubonense]|uniref:DUF2336 domain-containing protein n=1 Tax=Rhizobium tubonense TaxID=484088 RepID=A0A2W4EVK5_9HYPH|nr:hypothetical protein CPY51_02415 [Rhizobium tubonense]